MIRHPKGSPDAETKPLIPLYPYQCPFCCGAGYLPSPSSRIRDTQGVVNILNCADCKWTGIVWLPTPHPESPEKIQAIANQMLKIFMDTKLDGLTIVARGQNEAA